MSQDYDYLLKVLLVGDSGVGKTSLFNQYVTNKFTVDTTSTVGVEFTTKNVILEVDGHEVNIKLQLWDTAGQERYRTMTQTYYRGASGALLIYDITQQDTFQQCEQWLSEIQERAGQQCQIIIIGNKKDLENSRQVQLEEGQNLSERKNTLFFETSAQDSKSVTEAFDILLRRIVEVKNKQQANQGEEFIPQKVEIIENAPVEAQKSKKCC